jgi:hypothetical protein
MVTVVPADVPIIAVISPVTPVTVIAFPVPSNILVSISTLIAIFVIPAVIVFYS